VLYYVFAAPLVTINEHASVSMPSLGDDFWLLRLFGSCSSSNGRLRFTPAVVVLVAAAPPARFYYYSNNNTLVVVHHSSSSDNLWRNEETRVFQKVARKKLYHQWEQYNDTPIRCTSRQ